MTDTINAETNGKIDETPEQIAARELAAKEHAEEMANVKPPNTTHFLTTDEIERLRRMILV